MIIFEESIVLGDLSVISIKVSFVELMIGVLKFLPWVGIWTWTVATFIGVGAALSTKFGRREPWFEAA